jgi:hypothetical protein
MIEDDWGRPTHEQGVLFMEYYKLWDTPFDNEAWNMFRRLLDEGSLSSHAEFVSKYPAGDPAYGMVDRVLCSFEQAGVLMRNGLMHPALYFEGWAPPEEVWDEVKGFVAGLRVKSPASFTNMEWLAERAREWRATHAGHG